MSIIHQEEAIRSYNRPGMAAERWQGSLSAATDEKIFTFLQNFSVKPEISISATNDDSSRRGDYIY